MESKTDYTMNMASKEELRRQIYFDPPTIDEALKNYMSWFVAQSLTCAKAGQTNPWTSHDVLCMTRMLSQCINQHICSTENHNHLASSIWNTVQHDRSCKITQTLGRVALQTVWDQLDKSTVLQCLNPNDNMDQDDNYHWFLSPFETALFAPLEQNELARLIWNTDQGKEELTRRAMQRQVQAIKRSEEAKKTESESILPRIEEIVEENQD